MASARCCRRALHWRLLRRNHHHGSDHLPVHFHQAARLLAVFVEGRLEPLGLLLKDVHHIVSRREVRYRIGILRDAPNQIVREVIDDVGQHLHDRLAVLRVPFVGAVACKPERPRCFLAHCSVLALPGLQRSALNARCVTKQRVQPGRVSRNPTLRNALTISVVAPIRR